MRRRRCPCLKSLCSRRPRPCVNLAVTCRIMCGCTGGSPQASRHILLLCDMGSWSITIPQAADEIGALRHAATSREVSSAVSVRKLCGLTCAAAAECIPFRLQQELDTKKA